MSYYEGIEAVKELDDAGSVNDHLKNGWILLAIKEKSKTTIDPAIGHPVYEISIVYVVGYKGVDQGKESLDWVSTTGPKGPYELLKPCSNPLYLALLRELQDHQGKLAKDVYFMWLFKDGAIGRKRKEMK